MLSTLMIFVTGLDRVPPLGLHPTPGITFEHPEDCGVCGPLPYANTCTNTLTLPVMRSYEEFEQLMLNALEMGITFTDK